MAYKIIVAGCGGMSDHWIEIAKKRDDCEIVALVDVNNEAANNRKQKHSLQSKVYSKVTEALEKETADILFDVTVPEAHFEVVTTALKAGCHVFGEKPMSDSLENAEKMLSCAIEAKREYFVMQNRRYLSGLVTLKNFLQSRKLGRIGQISANFQLGPHFGGFRDEMDSPLIADMAIHTFDTARFITGKNAVSVYTHEFNPSWSWYKGNASAVCIFEMEDGSVFDYRGSWCAKGLDTSWEAEWRVSCENGAVFCDGAKKLYYEFVDGAKKTAPAIEEIPLVKIEHEGHQGCVREMFEALKNGKKAQTDCSDNINSIRMVYKAIESAKTKKKLDWR